jgi:succinate-semialdehyde dehydrogenase/glutarate-semialdehyde dehydrogenase
MMVPFNFPLQSGFRGGISALLAGNSLLVKTTSCCPALAELVEKLVMEAGFNRGEYQCIHAPHEMIDKILQYPSVAGVSFTGSTKSGSDIASKAGKYLKKTVM